MHFSCEAVFLRLPALGFVVSVRVIPHLNELPEEIVNAYLMETFKSPLDARLQLLFLKVPL